MAAGSEAFYINVLETICQRCSSAGVLVLGAQVDGYSCFNVHQDFSETPENVCVFVDHSFTVPSKYATSNLYIHAELLEFFDTVIIIGRVANMSPTKFEVSGFSRLHPIWDYYVAVVDFSLEVGAHERHYKGRHSSFPVGGQRAVKKMYAEYICNYYKLYRHLLTISDMSDFDNIFVDAGCVIPEPKGFVFDTPLVIKTSTVGVKEQDVVEDFVEREPVNERTRDVFEQLFGGGAESDSEDSSKKLIKYTHSTEESEEESNSGTYRSFSSEDNYKEGHFFDSSSSSDEIPPAPPTVTKKSSSSSTSEEVLKEPEVTVLVKNAKGKLEGSPFNI
jgi:hypothetical protein